MNAIRVLHVIDHMGLGGAQTVLVRLLPELRKAGIDVTLLVLRGTSPQVDVLRAAGVDVQCLEMSRWHPLQLLRFAQVVRLLHPDILHASLFRGWLLSMVVALFHPRLRLVLHDHSGPAHNIKAPSWLRTVAYAVQRLVQPRVDLFLCVSRANARYAQTVWGVPPTKLKVLYNPFVEPIVSPERRHLVRQSFGLSPDAIMVLCLGRLSYEKGLDVLVDAFATLDESVLARLHVFIAGDGPERAPLKARVNANGLGGTFDFLGHRNDVSDLLAAADILVQPSRHESLPISVLEAMSAGVAVVGTDVGGIPELLQHGLTGMIVPPDNPARLACAIEELVTDRGLREHLERTAQEQARLRFNSQETIRKFIDCYEELLRPPA